MYSCYAVTDYAFDKNASLPFHSIQYRYSTEYILKKKKLTCCVNFSFVS